MSRREQAPLEIPVFCQGSRAPVYHAQRGRKHTLSSVLIHMRGMGLLYKEIAHLTGVSPAAISDYLGPSKRLDSSVSRKG